MCHDISSRFSENTGTRHEVYAGEKQTYLFLSTDFFRELLYRSYLTSGIAN